MVDYVRARNADGVIESVPVRKYELRPDRWTPVDGDATDRGGNPLPPVSADDMPAKNASTDEWRSYATTHGLSSESTAEMSRDSIVAHFTQES